MKIGGRLFFLSGFTIMKETDRGKGDCIMNPYDFKDFGDEIKDAVQKAIDSEDFSNLNQTIKHGMEKAAQAMGDGLKTVGKTAEEKAHEAVQNHPWTKEWKNKKQEVALYQKTSGKKAGAIVCMFFGYLCGGGLGIALLVLCLIAAALGEFALGLRIPVVIMLPLFLGSMGLGIFGHRKWSMICRFEKYKGYLAGKTYGNFTSFSNMLHKPISYVKKDLKKMVEKRWFLQGHFDEEGTCLITSDETYQDYLDLKEKRKQQKLEEEKKKAETKNLTPEVEGVIEEGKAFLQEIHRSNEAIPGEEISAKIASIEKIVKKIFERIEEYPEMVGDIRKLMEYYLPMTVKLLNAYEELDGQPVQGENILSSKKEIEDSLNTLNLAFEKLLDRLFQEQAWDVSSDISVLKTMLAQDGLAQKDF